MSPEQLAAALGCPLERAAKWLPALDAAMAAYAIDSPARRAAFLAQIGHESGRLQYVRELWGPTPAQAGYEGRIDLGNTQKGDGFRFRGRGLIQITGRENYRTCGAALGLDLERQPELLEQRRYAALSAGWYWYIHGLNALADGGEVNQKLICRAINGGINGFSDRLALYQIACGVLNVNT